MPDPTEPLSDRLRRGDAAALGPFIDEQQGGLLGFIASRLGPALRGKLEPQDVLQEVAVKAMRELPRTDLSRREPFGWLCQLAEQCIIDDSRHFSAAKRSNEREVPLQGMFGEGSQEFLSLLAASLTSPTQAAARNERGAQLQAALAELPDDTREVLRLRYFEGLPTKEIAQRVGKTDVAVRVLLTRTLHKLQDLLGGSAAP
jgi:RNA polymerase sigma-70 factor (ECF subfamily)